MSYSERKRNTVTTTMSGATMRNRTNRGDCGPELHRLPLKLGERLPSHSWGAHWGERADSESGISLFAHACVSLSTPPQSLKGGGDVVSSSRVAGCFTASAHASPPSKKNPVFSAPGETGRPVSRQGGTVARLALGVPKVIALPYLREIRKGVKHNLTLVFRTPTLFGVTQSAEFPYVCQHIGRKRISSNAPFTLRYKALGVQNLKLANAQIGSELGGDRSGRCLLAALNARQASLRQSGHCREVGLSLVLAAASFTEWGLNHGDQYSYLKCNFQASNCSF